MAWSKWPQRSRNYFLVATMSGVVAFLLGLLVAWKGPYTIDLQRFALGAGVGLICVFGVGWLQEDIIAGGGSQGTLKFILIFRMLPVALLALAFWLGFNSLGSAIAGVCVVLAGSEAGKYLAVRRDRGA